MGHERIAANQHDTGIASQQARAIVTLQQILDHP
jgi:Tfp pilus assembly protein PilX